MSGTHKGNLPGIPATGKRFSSVRGSTILELEAGKIRQESDYWDAREISAHCLDLFRIKKQTSRRNLTLVTKKPKKALRFERWDEFGAARNKVERCPLSDTSDLWYYVGALIHGVPQSKPNVVKRPAFIPNGCTPLHSAS